LKKKEDASNTSASKRIINEAPDGVPKVSATKNKNHQTPKANTQKKNIPVASRVTLSTNFQISTHRSSNSNDEDGSDSEDEDENSFQEQLRHFVRESRGLTCFLINYSIILNYFLNSLEVFSSIPTHNDRFEFLFYIKLFFTRLSRVN
jgi:hypothetical protein